MTRKTTLLLCLFLLLTLFSACQTEPPVDLETSSTGEHAAVDVTLPVQETLQTKLIEILPWNAGRAEETDCYFTAETEHGFYVEYGAMLYYADKSDMTNWVIVCPDAECEHKEGDPECGACIIGTFVVKNDRIYYLTRKNRDMERWAQVEGFSTPFIVSMALDGTDSRIEHIFGTPENTMRSDSFSGAMFMTKDYAIESACYLNADGTYDAWLTVVDEDGEYTLHVITQENDNAHFSPWRRRRNIFGPITFASRVLDEKMTKAFRLEGRELASVDFGDLDCDGGYLSGDILWVFRPDDGYYSVNLTTGEEVKLAENQLQHSQAYIALPNCILESTLLGYGSCESRAEVQQHSLRFFDGVQWWEIELPEELQNMDAESYLELATVASDRILFVFSQGMGQEQQWKTYQIMLGTEEPELEALGQLYVNRTPIG